MIKRVIDVIFSLFLIISISPILILISAAIKLTSRGPVIFKQKRIGADNKEFIFFKFRTMKCGTPNVATELLEDSDSYITAIGRLLRKSSLDELPQLFNILFGQMTFVGPRPALYNQYELIEMRTKVGVHRLVPGVTGWAQVNGRDVLSDEQKVEFDRKYLKKKSVRFDFRIVFMTVVKVLRAEGVLEGGNRVVVDEGNARKVEM